MNILLVVLANGSDHQRYASYVANELANEHSITLVTTLQYNDKLLIHDNIRLINELDCRTSRVEWRAISLSTWRIILKQIKEASPDVIHFMTAHPLNILIAFSFKRIPQIFTIHDVMPHPEEGISYAVKMYNNVVCTSADRIVVHSKLARKQLGKYMYKAKSVPLAAEMPTRNPINISRTSKVLFYGRIKPYKGLDLFILAAEKVLRVFPNAQFVIAGSGDISRYLPLIKSKSNFEIVNQYLSDEEANHLVRTSLFLVLPYTSATQSGVIPIAFSSSTPVIATDVGAIAEMVIDQKTGILVKVDVDEISNAMIRLLTDVKFTEKLGQGAYGFYMENMRPNIMVEQLNGIYKSSVQSDRTPS